MKRRRVYVLILLSLLVVVSWLHAPVRAQSPNRVGLVVRFGGGSVITRCVEFGEQEISGYDVLMRSGLDVVAYFDSGLGAAICAIEGTGCPLENCLTCATPNYWSYWHLVGGAWTYSPVGASGYKVHNGDVEGWSWEAGQSPPIIAFDEICAPPSPTDTPVPPTDTPVPPTATSPPAPPTATSPPPTPAVWFRLDTSPISAGTCTIVRWDTANALEVYLDGEQVDLNGDFEACPTAPQEFHLRVLSAAGEQTHTLVLSVTGAPSPTPTPEPTASGPPSPGPATQPTTAASPLPSFTPQPVAAASPSPTDTSSPEPMAAPTPSPRPARSASAITQPVTSSQQPATTSSAPYVVFGFITIGLVGLLIFGVIRRR
jgi:hypothetical protein